MLRRAEPRSILSEGIHQFRMSLSDLFFPPVCGFCEAALREADSFLCDNCRDSVERVNEPVCVQCGLPFPGLAVAGAGRCGRCLTDPPPYDRARYALYYQGAVREALVRFKFAGALHIAFPLSQILSEAFRRHFQLVDLDFMVPVPIHRTRLIHRGFNQVVELAKRLSRDTGIPLDRTSLKKIKDTPPQVGLPRTARVRNLRGSFGIHHSNRIRGRKVLLVDDVATTGSTIAEAARTLMRGGAARVDALVLAVREAVSAQAGNSATPGSPESFNVGKQPL